MKTKLAIFLISILCASNSFAFFLQSNSEKFSMAVSKLNQLSPDSDNAKELDDIINTFNDLINDSYDEKNSLVLFYRGKALRQRGNESQDINSLNEASNDFKKYKELTLKANNYDGYKAGVVLSAYTLNDISNLRNDGDYSEPQDEINQFISNKKFSDQVDGSVYLCKANIYNSTGFYFYKKNDFKSAISNLEIACSLKKNNWPIFSNNLISAYIAAYENTKKIQYLYNACSVYELYKNKSYWKNNDQFKSTGTWLENCLKDEKISCPKSVK